MMTSAVEGSASVVVGAGVGRLYIVVAAVPEHSTANQTYGYELEVSWTE